ncbi:N-acetylmuramoyl-L-alanine amidase family protein [Paenibacillus spongiae]|uniref:N-acetylmuramoyl-L-alanine amidase n=1 Tax=Paenibacillus spongiae TaxID=2909671 RepID=A0ABY5S245_9BACL|nr:N-acetylmuramoyl-L-alanine amidase [Paenibacillus spongiae]UVI27932.1 N-acetylmuramoyl-L-alanine amidase [Paenibacillus spongiae]
MLMNGFTRRLGRTLGMGCLLLASLMNASPAGASVPERSELPIPHPTRGPIPAPAQAEIDPLSDPDYHRALPTADIIIDAGHGGIDGGAYVGDIKEKDINLAIAKKLYLLLSSSGVRTILNRNGDYALSEDNRWFASRSRHKRDLSQRSQLSKEIQTRIVVSLHVNSGKNKSVRGPLVLHQDEGQSALLAYCIQDALNRQQNTRKLPELGKPFYLLNVVEQPAVIVEMGFISNEQDRRMLTDPRYQLQTASAIASGIRNYLLLR